MAMPHTATDQSTARPWRRTRPVHPLTSDATNAPAATDDEQQSVQASAPPPSRSASAGNSARGMPNTMARRSMPNTLMMIECPRRKRSPSNTDDAVAPRHGDHRRSRAIAANTASATQ